MVLKGSETVFSRGNSRAFFSALQLLRCSLFVVIRVLFGALAFERGFYNKTRAFLAFLALHHPAQELKSSFVLLLVSAHT